MIFVNRWRAILISRVSNPVEVYQRLLCSWNYLKEDSTLNFEEIRCISSFHPLYMGRRSCRIAGRKEAQNAKKGKRYTKIGKEVVSAIKRGGGTNPTSNTILAAVLERAKELDVPKEIVERNIKKALEKGQGAYFEKFYEVYGFGGVGMIVEVMTDKITRSIADVRLVVRECGGKMADSGSIMFKFKQCRVVSVKAADADKDQLLDIALDAGAEDVLEPLPIEDCDEDDSDRYYNIVCSSKEHPMVLSKLRQQNIKFEPDNGVELLPLATVERRRGGGGNKMEALLLSWGRYSDSLTVVAVSIMTALICESISWMIIYRTSSYKSLRSSIHKASKKLESMKLTDNNKAITKKSSKNKKMDRVEVSLKESSRDLSLFKFKSGAVVALVLLLVFASLNSLFEGKVVAKLPFQPLSFLTKMSHRGLQGHDYTDCSMAFLYFLCSLSIRTNLQKLLGFSPPRGSPNSGLFPLPDPKTS